MSEGSQVFYHDDGYVEVVLHGILGVEALAACIQKTRDLFVARESPANLLIDGRLGRAAQETASYHLMRRTEQIANLDHIIVLENEDPAQSESITGELWAATFLGAAQGKRPLYFTDETRARTAARNKD